MVAEDLGCKWSRFQSWVPPGAEQGSNSQEAKVELSQEEGLLQPESPGTCAHFQMHLQRLPRLGLQNQNQSLSWSEAASQRRSLLAGAAEAWAAGAWRRTGGGR